ncbi:MAG: phosphotransferase, partial [Gemmatimonadetes bacterium]|nr:phosphotransferase [Gemmatimonadota bacterium]NIR78491.1 phosphotransferase [Gemmatimonadota bacterium]NIT87106.1 phosphotransferase [Gemmatimonadota bacterium]NIU30948.1 phosphotransferase [Gemmatimonadota bacterium]NIU35703.1 phosphotransferase [Gemmatimonadota bacterium]
MKIAPLIKALRRPEAYPHPVGEVEVRQTHISAVFLAGPFVYKVKKPVDLGFLDFTTLERRLHFCREEVRLNRRLAPEVYLGVVTVREGEGGSLTVGQEPVGEGLETGGAPGEKGSAAIEYAVKMRRLPDGATLEARLERGEEIVPVLERLGRRIAAFHRKAASGPRVARFGRLEVVAGNARENLEQAKPHVGETVSEAVHGRLGRVLEARLEELGGLIEDRARRGVPRDTHGDLHLEHVYVLPDREPPGDLVVIDCIEFNERFRYSDPISDMAFLSMDLLFHGRPALERVFSGAYGDASDDGEGMALLPFYRSYRAAVRGKVEGMVTEEEEVPVDERRRAVGRARGHWLLALSELEAPGDRPALVLVGGLPGTGKSTLAEALAR